MKAAQVSIAPIVLTFVNAARAQLAGAKLRELAHQRGVEVCIAYDGMTLTL